MKVSKPELLRLKDRVVYVNNKLEDAWDEIEKVGTELQDIEKTIREMVIKESK